MTKTAVVALGGGTILRPTQRGSADEQLENLRETCARLARLVQEGWRLVLTHGNGPQVGNIVLQNQHARSLVPPMPLDVCGAQSQGQIGYLLQTELENALQSAGLRVPVASVITRVLVADSDPSFDAPEKAVGPIYTAAKAADLMRLGVAMKEVARGWRQVVPSPQPAKVLETPVVRSLLDAGSVVITAGGGGIPVVQGRNGEITGVEAVIEKDLTTSLLAVELEADLLVLLTDVPRVVLHYGTPEQQDLTELTVAECRQIVSGSMCRTSMGVKVDAAARFVEQRARPALITSGDQLFEAMAGQSGTFIVAAANRGILEISKAN